VRVDREGRIALIWSVLCSLVIDRYVYWGEYPLSFAACLGQEECYRLILARGADPNLQDFNGNTVLHLLIIYEKIVSNDSLLTSKITALQNVNFR
jgi:ankyrin repeat protein